MTYVNFILNNNQCIEYFSYFRKNFSETEIEILVSKFDVDGNTMFTTNEINAIQDNDVSKLEDDEP